MDKMATNRITTANFSHSLWLDLAPEVDSRPKEMVRFKFGFESVDQAKINTTINSKSKA